MNIRTALILLLEFVLALGLIAAAIWAIEYFILGGPMPAKIRMVIAIAFLILLAIFLLGGGRPPLVTW